MHLQTHPSIVIVKETEDFNKKLFNVYLPYSDALIMKNNLDIIQINMLIKSIEPNYLIVDSETDYKRQYSVHNRFEIEAVDNCKIIFQSNNKAIKFDLPSICENNYLKISELIQTAHPDLMIVDSNKMNANFKQCVKNIDESISNKCQIVFVSDIKNSIPAVIQSFANNTETYTLPNLDCTQTITIKNKQYISLPTNTGFKIVNKQDIVLFTYNKINNEKSRWEVLLNTDEVFKLKVNAVSKDFLKHYEPNELIMICPQNFVNIKYLNSVELKSRNCMLQQPFDNIKLVASRNCFSEIKNLFDM